MARFRSKRSLPVRGVCPDVGPGLQAALDAADGSAVAAILRARPEPPDCVDPDRRLFDWFGFLAIGSETEPFLLDLGRPGLSGRIGECSTCERIALVIASHPLMASDTPERRAFVAKFTVRPDDPAHLIPTTEVFDHGN